MAIRLKDRIEANIRQSDKVNNSLSIQLNSGAATVYDGSSVKSINITPATINAVNKSGDTMTGTLVLGSSTQSTAPSMGIHVHDLRNYTPSQNMFGNQQVNWYFYNVSDYGWRSIMHTKGWTGTDYAAWEIAGPANNSLDTNFLLRSYHSTSASDWLAILHSGNYTSYTVTKTGSGASGTWNIDITGNAATASGNLPHFFITTATEIAKIPKEAKSGWYHMAGGDATVLPTSNHGSVLIENDCGTPYQIFFPDNSLYIYKRYGSSSWNSWSKISAGYADSAGTATSATKLATARTISIADNDGTNIGPTASFDGTTNIIINLPSKIKTNISWESITDKPSYLPLSGGTLTGPLFLNGQNLVVHTIDNEPNVTESYTYGHHALCLGYSGNDQVNWYEYGGIWNFYKSRQGTLTKLCHIDDSGIHGAVWNDYAEYRSGSTTEPGRVVQECPDGILRMTTKRLEPACEIISDTFGFAIGETEECKTPIAATGRVLAYTDCDRYSFNLGDAVCSGENGTVSKMTREEIMMYPERIIGTVSEIPEYETWGTGNVAVNGRIWIRIR